jgi:hypothetical protein
LIIRQKKGRLRWDEMHTGREARLIAELGKQGPLTTKDTKERKGIDRLNIGDRKLRDRLFVSKSSDREKSNSSSFPNPRSSAFIRGKVFGVGVGVGLAECWVLSASPGLASG